MKSILLLSLLGTDLLLASTQSPQYFRLHVHSSRDEHKNKFELTPFSQLNVCAENSCKNVNLLLPASCDWECQDGVLSGRGLAIVRGSFNESGDFLVEAAFDTWRKVKDKAATWRVSTKGKDKASCSVIGKTARCLGDFQAVNLSSGKQQVAKVLDFSTADDVNYQLDPQRINRSIDKPEGVLLSGTFKGSVLKAQLVYRQWTPELPPLCEPFATLSEHISSANPMSQIFLVQNPSELPSVNASSENVWVYELESDRDFISYEWGRNDLWIERVKINKADCQLQVIGEH